MQRIILGTRASALALAQTELCRAALLGAWPHLEVAVETFVTRGDRKLDLDLRQVPAGGKGLFTRELEEALLDRRIDVAVHSLKDLPGHQPPGLMLGAVLPRAATADVLIARHPGGLDALPQGATVGTSSVRRARQLQWLRPDLRIVEWRGNVQTRLRKLAERPECAGIVLAQAGLDRLGFPVSSGSIDWEGATFPVTSLEDRMLPAIGQGVIGLQIASARGDVASVLASVNDSATWTAVRGEREMQRILAGDCTLPVGVRTTVRDGVMRMEAVLFGAEGASPSTATAEGSKTAPETVAALLCERLVA